MPSVRKEVGAVVYCFILSTAAGWSQVTIIEQTKTTVPSSTSQITTITRSPIENINKRLLDIQSWINKGMNHGWLSFLQVANFDQQVEQLRNNESSLIIRDGLYDRAKADAMEKKVNQLSIDVGQAMNNHSVAGGNTMR